MIGALVIGSGQAIWQPLNPYGHFRVSVLYTHALLCDESLTEHHILVISFDFFWIISKFDEFYETHDVYLIFFHKIFQIFLDIL